MATSVKKIISEMKNKIQNNPELATFKNMPWDKVNHGTKC
jgi:hypothetical protein